MVQTVGAWVLCFRKPRQNTDLESIRLSLTTIRWVIEHHAGHAYATSEPLLLAVGMQQTVSPRLEIESEEWEDVCRECGGWEWIDGEIAEVDGPKGERQSEEQRNEFGGRFRSPLTFTGYTHILIADSPSREGRHPSPKGSFRST